jgi:hypothetical protein
MTSDRNCQANLRVARWLVTSSNDNKLVAYVSIMFCETPGPIGDLPKRITMP